MTTHPDLTDTDLSALISAARRIEQRIAAALADPRDSGADPEVLQPAAKRLTDSVIRPLATLAQPEGTGHESRLADEATTSLTIDAELYQLALDATRLRAGPGAPASLIEATAALQDLACRLAPSTGPDSAAVRATEFAALQSALAPGIRVAADGPYLVSNAERMTNWLGEPVAARPQTALCRCGASASKPFCDGSHARVGFSGAKDPGRVPDRRDTYPGVQVTVLDNRGICAHSGLCTDRLSRVFRADREPFVAPSGGRMDEIVNAVRACPSGALSYAVDGREAREQVDRDRPGTIEVTRDGPYRVTGSLPLTGDDGEPEPRAAGSSVEHYSLCRCGQSANKPFCSGAHWYADFHDPALSEEPSLFEWAGGLPALRRMTRLFYEKYVPEDELLAPLFASMSPDHPERVAAWLGETFGGPKAYSGEYGGYDRMVGQHAGRALSQAQRSRWARLIVQAADDAGLPADPEFRAAFVAYIEWGSRIAVENSQPGAHPPRHMPVPRWWWVCDATPNARVSALAVQTDPEEPAMELPADGQPLSFADHIKPLFRTMDRQSMKSAFDLWSHQDVSRHADAILARVRQGSMPCDGAWPAQKVDVFDRWIQAGMPE